MALLFIPALFLCVGCIEKQNKMATTGTVKGVLLDQSGQPVPNAVIMVAGGTGSFTDMASITNDSGEFYLSNLSLPGSYSLQIQSGGDSVHKQVQLSAPSDTIRLVY